jgi:signal transduction histidine kinase
MVFHDSKVKNCACYPQSFLKGVRLNMDFDDLLSNSSRLFPAIAVQLRAALGNLHFSAAALAPAEKREKDPELDAKAAILNQCYYQLLRLANNLTMAAYLEQDTLLPSKDQDIVGIVRGVCDCSASLADLLGIRFSFTCDMEYHLCAVFNDSIEQLLFQLLSNAFKFTKRGGRIHVELKSSGEQLLLTVTDSGCGIPEERLPMLFDCYLHSDTMNPPPHGLGLGLPLCRRIAEGHGGKIMVESRIGVGTCVRVSLPDCQTGKSTVSDCPFDYAGGFNRTLLALSDALPPEAFLQKNMD